MSKLIGRKLPKALRHRISRQNGAAHLVVPLISVDDAGLPHPALISLYELILCGKELYFFISQHSKTCANLEKRRVVAMLFVEPTGCFYLKGHARLEGKRRGQAVFQLDLASVLEDFPTSEEGAAVLVSSARFQADLESLEHREYLRSEVLELLQR